MYEKVILGVTKTAGKKLLFSVDERIEMVRDSVSKRANIDIYSFDRLVVELASEYGARTIIRGLRAVSDFEHEFQMAQLNKKLAPEIETIFIMASPEFGYLSSSAVKEIASFGGEISTLVPKTVELKLKSKYSK